MKRIITLLVCTVFGSAALATPQWTKGTYDASTWEPPEDALPGQCVKSGGNLDGCNNFKVDESYGFDDRTEIWKFADPKDLSSVQILMNGVSYYVAYLGIQYAGSDTNVHEIAGSDYAFNTSTSGRTSLTFSDEDGYFATNVVALHVAITNAYPHWANHNEIVVRGDPVGCDIRWKLGTFVDSDAYAPAADKLGGLVIPGNDNSGASGANIADGDLSTYWYSSGDLVWNFDKPKRIRRVAVYSENNTIFSGIYVKYDGDSGYSRLAGSSLDNYVGPKNCVKVELEREGGFLARGVVSVKFKVESLSWRVGVHEVEVDGEDSFPAALAASYEIGGGRLNTTLTPTASAYPQQVWLCSGATDGGKDTNGWDRVEKAFVFESSDPVVDSRTVDFKYCRYCFADLDNVAWTEPFALSIVPSGSVAVVSTRRYDADVAVDIEDCGGTNEVADVWYAQAADGEELPEYKLLASGVAARTSVTNHLTGLSETSAYAYSFKIVNANGGEKTLSGSFATKGECYWEKSAYSASMVWSRPYDRLAVVGSMYDDDLSTKDYMLSSKTQTVSFAEAKTIDSIELYALGSPDYSFTIQSISIMHSGDAEYHELPGSGLSYSESAPSGTQKLAIIRGSEGALATDVVGIRIIHGSWANAHAHGVAELVIRGYTPGSIVHWDVGRYTNTTAMASGDASTYSLYENELPGLSLGKSSNLTASVTDHDIATDVFTVSSSWGEGSLVWTFEKPHDLTRLRIIAGTGDYCNFRCTGVYVKHEGDADYSLILGSVLDGVSFGKGTYGILTPASGRYLARGVVAVKADVSRLSGNWRCRLAESDLSGRESPRGFMMLVR